VLGPKSEEHRCMMPRHAGTEEHGKYPQPLYNPWTSCRHAWHGLHLEVLKNSV
jgi:hypothetical protein